MENKHRLLFAAVDIGWRISTYQKFLEEELGDRIKIESFVKYKVPDKHFRASYTYQIPLTSYPGPIRWLISLLFFLMALFKYSHFYFFSGETLLTRRSRSFELKVYKLLGKKVIFHFVGSDIRDPEYLKWKADHIRESLAGESDHEKSKEWQKALLKDSQKYADQIFVSTPDLLEICPAATYFPLTIDVEQIKNEIQRAKLDQGDSFKTDKLRILHAPSNPMTKGSALICKAIEELDQEGLVFEYIYTPDLDLKENSAYPVSRYQLFGLYEEADIVIDQMVIGWYGMQSIEALLASCSVVCYIDEHLENYLSSNCPLINTDAIHLKTRMRELINKGKPKANPDLTKQWISQAHSLETKGQLLSALFK